MIYLLDSHALLWLLAEPERIEAGATQRLQQANSRLCISIATIWEIEIKRNLGKLDMPALDWRKLHDSGLIEVLPTDIEDAVAAAALPPFHRDPFDRMIIAQGQRRGLTIVTRDEAFVAYGAKLLRC